MTHDKLLEEIDDFIQYTFNLGGGKALRAVVELHKPFDDMTCRGCLNTAYGDYDPYPCQTIQAI